MIPEKSLNDSLKKEGESRRQNPESREKGKQLDLASQLRDIKGKWE